MAHDGLRYHVSLELRVGRAGRGKKTYLTEDLKTMVGVMSVFCRIGVTAVVVDNVFQSALFDIV